jgi:DNA helicase II / ATP-dependent DNA helicase PcrA
VQDFAPLQLCVLRAHTDGLTLVGDIAQGIHSYRGLASWTEATQALDGMSPRLAMLNRGYRSTRQITQFGNALLGKIKGADPVEPFPRDGARVYLQRVSDATNVVRAAASCVVESLRRGAATIAVIAKTSLHARQVHGVLRDLLPARPLLILSRDVARSSPVVVLPAYLAKGLEFDAAIVIDVDERHYTMTQYDANLLYIGVSRALHQLFIVWAGRPSPLLSEVVITR